MTSLYTKSLTIAGTLLLVFTLSVMPGCSTDRVIGENQSLQVQIPMAYKSTLADRYQMIVEGVDIEPQTIPLELINGILIGEFTVTAGLNRHFIAQALDAQGVVIYQGDTYADVIAGIPTQVNINLVPIVPMINITPHNQALLMSNQFTFDINIFGVPNLRYINFNISELSEGSVPAYMDTAWVGPVNSSNPYFSFYILGSNMVDIYVENGYAEKSPDSSLTDDFGNAKLATIHFFTHTDTNDTIVTATFRPNLYYLDYLFGPELDTVSRMDILFDNAEVILIKPLFGE